MLVCTFLFGLTGGVFSVHAAPEWNPSPQPSAKTKSAAGITGSCTPVSSTNKDDTCRPVTVVCTPLVGEGEGRPNAACHAATRKIFLSLEDCAALGLTSGVYCESCLLEILNNPILVPDEQKPRVIEAGCALRHEFTHCEDGENGPVRSCLTEEHALRQHAQCLEAAYERFCRVTQPPFWCSRIGDLICQTRALSAGNACICEKSREGELNFQACRECTERVCGTSIYDCRIQYGRPPVPPGDSDPCPSAVLAYCLQDSGFVNPEGFMTCVDGVINSLGACLNAPPELGCHQACIDGVARCFNRPRTPAETAWINRMCQREITDLIERRQTPATTPSPRPSPTGRPAE